MKKKTPKRKSKDFSMIVTQKDYEREMRAGLKPDETFRPGIYREGVADSWSDILRYLAERRKRRSVSTSSWIETFSSSLRNRQRSLTQRRIKRRSTLPSARSLNESENRRTFPN